MHKMHRNKNFINLQGKSLFLNLSKHTMHRNKNIITLQDNSLSLSNLCKHTKHRKKNMITTKVLKYTKYHIYPNVTDMELNFMALAKAFQQCMVCIHNTIVHFHNSPLLLQMT